MTKALAAAAAAGLTLALVPPSMAAGSRAAASQVRPQVAGLQVALRAWGMYAGPIDAVDGAGTRAAVRAFQQRAGLAADGIAGRKTRAALGPLGQPLADGAAAVDSVAFSPDGHTLASGNADDSIRLWNLNVQDAIQRICATAGGLTPQQWNQYIPQLQYQPSCSH